MTKMNDELEKEIFDGLTKIKIQRAWRKISGRVYQQTLPIQQIVEIQPMSLPTGLVFFIDEMCKKE
jgi:hypothetical protein